MTVSEIMAHWPDSSPLTPAYMLIAFVQKTQISAERSGWRKPRPREYSKCGPGSSLLPSPSKRPSRRKTGNTRKLPLGVMRGAVAIVDSIIFIPQLRLRTSSTKPVRSIVAMEHSAAWTASIGMSQRAAAESTALR